MKKLIGILLLTLVAGICIGQKTARFDSLQREDLRNDDFIKAFETFHDNESGVEFICVFGSVETHEGTHSVSCFPTGRNWR